MAVVVRRCPGKISAGSAVPRRRSVSRSPSSNRACGSPAPGFPRSFTGPLSAAPPAFACRYRARGRSRALSPGVGSLSSTHQRCPPRRTQTAYGPFPPPCFGGHGLTSRVPSGCGRSDSRSTLPHFTGPPLHPEGPGSSLPVHVLGRLPRRRTAGARVPAGCGLSCSHAGCPTIPRPLRRWVLRGCISKRFTPSLAFAPRLQARLPVGPPRGGRCHDAADFA